MTQGANGVPEGFHTVAPYLFIGGAGDAIEYYKEVFGATELMRHTDADGRVRHAEIRIGDSPVMLTDEIPQMPGPRTLGGSPVHMFLYVGDVDATMERAVAAGARVLETAQDHPSEGDRRGGFEDPFGFVWWIGTQIEALSREEIQRRQENPTQQ